MQDEKNGETVAARGSEPRGETPREAEREEGRAADGASETLNPEVFAPEGAEREPVYVEALPKERRRFKAPDLRAMGARLRARLEGAVKQGEALARSSAKRAAIGAGVVLALTLGALAVREGILRLAMWRAESDETVSASAERAPEAATEEREAVLLLDEYHSLAAPGTKRETIVLPEMTREEIVRGRFEVAATPRAPGSLREVVFESPAGKTLAVHGYLKELAAESGEGVARFLDPEATIVIYYHEDAVSTGFTARVRDGVETAALKVALLALAESPEAKNLYLIDPGEREEVIAGEDAAGEVALVRFSKTKHILTLAVVSRGAERYIVAGTSKNVMESLRAMLATR